MAKISKIILCTDGDVWDLSFCTDGGVWDLSFCTDGDVWDLSFCTDGDVCATSFFIYFPSTILISSSVNSYNLYTSSSIFSHFVCLYLLLIKIYLFQSIQN